MCAVRTILDSIIRATAPGDKVEIRGFGHLQHAATGWAHWAQSKDQVGQSGAQANSLLQSEQRTSRTGG